jgi:hypothetical protein
LIKPKHALLFLVFFCLLGCASSVKQHIQTYQNTLIDKYTSKKFNSEGLWLGEIKDFCYLKSCVSYREYGPEFQTGFRSDIIRKEGKIIGYDSLFHFFKSTKSNNPQPYAILFPGYGMTTEHSAHYASWLKSIGYHVFAVQGPTESKHFDFNVTSAKVLFHLLKQQYNEPEVTVVSLSMGSVAALHFIQDYRYVKKYLAVAPMQRFDIAASEYSKLYGSKSMLSWFTPKSTIDDGITQVIKESGIDTLQTDFLHMAKQTPMPETVILASEGDTVSPSALFRNVQINNVSIDIVPFFKHGFFSTMAIPSEYSRKTIDFMELNPSVQDIE